MRVRTVPTRPYNDQRPGTSGLRKRVSAFRQPNYLENFIQAVLDILPGTRGGTLVLGGDGRYYNRDAMVTVLRMAVAHGCGRILIAAGGILSTPAASHLIRDHGACGGIILSASHNPGGPDGDFGVKVNIDNGGPAPERVTEAVYARASELDAYQIADCPLPDIDQRGTIQAGETELAVIDTVAPYAALMETLFDFDAIRRLFANGFRMVYDGMHAVTGPYAVEILERRLGAPTGTVIRAQPLEDFGGDHPDPNPIHARELMERLNGDDPPDFGAASDGDGDRNMILGPRCFVTPSDSLAVLAANARVAPGYRDGITGIARSMPTSRAADRVAAALGIPCFETPTGWKYFGNLLDDGRITLCGEESFGTSSNHVREKDGLWAVLFWLNLLAAEDRSVPEILAAHWRRFGRDYYTRHDYEALDAHTAEGIMADLRNALPGLPDRRGNGARVTAADEFSYTDPVTAEGTAGQGIRIFFEDGARAVFRLSGTGTQGATLRVYIERYRAGPEGLAGDPQEVLADLVGAVEQLSGIRTRSGRTEPSLII